MPAQNQTYLQITNAVLKRLRRATVSTFNETTYSTLISEFINDVKTEIEDAWYWYALRDTYSVTALPSTTSYTFTGAGRGAVILSAWNTTQQAEMDLSTNLEMDERFFGTTTVQTGPPTDYIPNGYDSAYDLKIDIWPSPTSTNALKFNLYVPQDDLASGSTVPLVPINVLIQGVFARALAERGDDSGQTAEKQEMIYRDLLASAIAHERTFDDTEYDWVPE